GAAANAAAEEVGGGLDGLAHGALGRGPDAVAPLEGVVDDLSKLGMRHVAKTLVKCSNRVCVVENRAGGVKHVAPVAQVPVSGCRLAASDEFPFNGCGRVV